VEISIKKDGKVIFDNCKVATSFFTRFMGLMGKKEMGKDETIIFPRCNSIHTFFMRMPIDVVFVSHNGRIVRIYHDLNPWKMLAPVKGAKHAVEMAAGCSAEKALSEGDMLTCDGVFG
jgi:uncharacterized membrane protein (UPF0127 family)